MVLVLEYTLNLLLINSKRLQKYCSLEFIAYSSNFNGHMFWPKFPRGSVKDCCWLPLTRQGRACGDPVSIESKCGSCMAWSILYNCASTSPRPAQVSCVHPPPSSNTLLHQIESFHSELRFKDCVLLKVERFRKSFPKC